MKLIHMLSVSVATVGMTCLAGYAAAANTAPGDLIPDSMLVGQGTAAPGGKGGGPPGEIGRGDKGSMRSGSTNPGMGTDGTFPEKAGPGGTAGSSTSPDGSSGGNQLRQQGSGSGNAGSKGTADAESSMRMQSEKNSPSGGSLDPKAPNAMGQSGREQGDTKSGVMGREDSSTGRSNPTSPSYGSGSMGGGSGMGGSD